MAIPPVLPEITGATTAWLWETFGNPITSFFAGIAGQIHTASQWKQAAKRYRENLYKQYNRIQIFGQSEPVPLEGVFTHLNILDKPSAFARYDIEALRDAIRKDPSKFHAVDRHPRDERIDGLKLITRPDSDRLFILGKPGAGKTTFLKYLTLQAILEKINAIPIFVSLKEWADSEYSDNLLAFLSSRFDICDFPDAKPFVKLILRKGKALVLFDGLDEVGREARERMRLIPTLTAFCTIYRKSQCLITCRTAATDYIFQGFKYVEVADFDESQMRVFVRKWFTDDTDLCDSFWEEFQKDEHRGLRELGRIPLLLTLLCLAYQETLNFPRRRVEIYEEALNALLKKWDSSRGLTRDVAYRKLSLGRKRQMFAFIAAEAFQEDNYFFRQTDLEKRIVDYLQRLPPANQDEDIDGADILKAIEAQHGILIERASCIYAFAHLTFQEYFTARYVVDNVGKGTIPHLLAHCTDDRWREVILLAASLLDEADDFFFAFLQDIHSLITADEKLLYFIRWATDKAASEQSNYKSAAVRGFYFYLALALDLDLDPTGILDLALALARDLDRNLACDLDLTRDLDRNLGRNFGLDRTSPRVRALNPPRSPTHSHNRARDLAIAIARARVLDLASDNVPSLHQVLTILDFPATDAPPEAWSSFVHKLQNVITINRNIGHQWKFTDEQSKHLHTYFRANRLLIECLDVARITDRTAIEDSLLLPPGT
jgi:predicted NACHT family NTPase